MKYLFLGFILFANFCPIAIIDYFPRVKQLAAGINHSTALLIDGTIWTFGKSSSGQLCDSTTADKNL